jgi:tetratricopeptide (TPR) repeat protein
LFVAWQGADKRIVSRVGILGLGGVFVYLPDPPPVDTIINLFFDLRPGEVRARAVVRSSRPGEGMGVEFMQMRAEDRGRLNQFLNRRQESPAGQPEPSPERVQTAPEPPPTPSPAGDRETPSLFQLEMDRLLHVAEKGTYYQLLNVSPNCSPTEMKHSFYRLARKFHPDRHMEQPDWAGGLQKLMDALTKAYKTLANEQQRAGYDKQLAASGIFKLDHGKTELQETAEECAQRAIELLRAYNFAGSIFWLRKCVRIAPNVARYRAMLARSLAAVKQYRREAIEEFHKAIELDPLSTSTRLQFGQLYEDMQLPWRARPLYQKILEIDPTHTEARERLRAIDAKEGKKAPKASPLVSRLFSRKDS